MPRCVRRNACKMLASALSIPLLTRYARCPSSSRRKGIFRSPMIALGEGRRLLAGQLRQVRDGGLVVIDPSTHHVRSSFGSQAITELARAIRLARLRPPILDPDARRLFRCIAPAFREDVLPLRVLQRRVVLAYELRLDRVSHNNLLVAVHDEDIGVFPHPWTLLLVKRGQVVRPRQCAGCFPYLRDDFPGGCLVLPHGDAGQGNDRKSRHNDKDTAVSHRGLLPTIAARERWCSSLFHRSAGTPRRRQFGVLSEEGAGD